MIPLIIEVNGVRVIGRITERAANNLDVELIYPYGRLRDGRSIMAAARPYCVSFEGLQGDEAAIEILAQIHQAAAYVHDHLAALQRKWVIVRKKLADRCFTVRSRAEYVEERVKSRRMLREELITSDEHQRWMIQLTNDLEEWELLVSQSVDALFLASGLELSLHLQQQLMRRIDPTFDLALTEVEDE